MARILSNSRATHFLAGLAVLSMMLGLVLYPAQSLQSAREGLRLCGDVIVPSLFPFFVLSALLVDLGLARYFGRALEGVMRPLFNVGGVCSTAFALGFIGGYPVGAKTVISLYQKRLCTRAEAERMLAFCNNSGPAFILGVVGAGVFSSSRIGVLIYLIHMSASVLVGVLFRYYRREEGGGGFRRAPSQIEAPRLTFVFTEAVKHAFSSTLSICAFVIFFTVVIRLLFLTGILPGAAALLEMLFSPFGLTRTWAERLLTGMIELTSGVWSLSGSGALAGRISMAAFMLGWAGVSIHFQVLSFIGNSGLSVRTYIVGKALHGLFSAGLVRLALIVVPLNEPVSSYLADQVADIVNMDFGSALTISVVVAWGVWLLFLLVSARIIRKNAGKRRRSVV